MTKKHFIELADVIRGFTPVINGNPGEYGYAMDYGRAQQHETLKEALADFYARQNPRFNRERWLGYIAGEKCQHGREKRRDATGRYVCACAFARENGKNGGKVK